MIQQIDTAEHLIEEQYAATDELPSEFRECFPHTFMAKVYAEALLGEEVAIEQPPTTTDFVEQVLGASDSGSSEEEGDEQVVTAEEYENNFEVV